MDTINTNIHDRLLSWLGVGGHISVSMDTINTNIHDRLLSWLGVGGHISVSMDTINTNIHDRLLSCLIVVYICVNGFHGNTNMTAYTKAGQ
jgi:hypothetical protein